jgi:hypothetical protein
MAIETDVSEVSASAVRVTASEFCADKSQTDKRVELLGGFYHYITVIKKKPKATRAEFEKCFQEFLALPA